MIPFIPHGKGVHSSASAVCAELTELLELGQAARVGLAADLRGLHDLDASGMSLSDSLG
jgi:hypothetical protein